MSKLPGLLKSLESKDRAIPLVMGILNVTPDSFSDGGHFNSKESMLSQIESMLEAGVDIIDIGGESTRPGANPVSLNDELDRVLPAIELVQSCSDVAISIDTYKPEVMQATIAKGVDMINDVNALQATNAVEVVSRAGIPVCLMHKKGDPLNMQQAPVYNDVTQEVLEFLLQRASVCEQAGILPEHILLDPGFGFGKTLEHNIDLFKNLSNFIDLKFPLLVGVSRKRMIGALMGDVDVNDRLCGSVAAAIVAANKGAKIIRVHDVEETIQALKVASILY
ncbi:MAG: dihydropteroate synthase [Pseudomonadota bacterium]|nr:dihydropteroate synthase [Pseudomonadota bacterium]